MLVLGVKIKWHYFITKLLFTTDSALPSVRQHFWQTAMELWFTTVLWFTMVNVFLGFLHKDTAVDCSINEHRFWPRPFSSTVLKEKSKQIEVEEKAVWLVILGKEVTNNPWVPL